MSARYHRATDVLWRRAPDSVLLLPRGEGTGDVVSLSGTGVVLWDLLEDEATLEELASTLAAAFGADADLVAADIQPVLDDLVSRCLIAEVALP